VITLLVIFFVTGRGNRHLVDIWIPRVVIAFCILLLIYFTQRAYRFKGQFDDTFLAPENLNLVRGPLAQEDYYSRGLTDYKGKPLFSAESPASVEDATLEQTAPIPQNATPESASP
jgi:hypothetical protein